MQADPPTFDFDGVVVEKAGRRVLGEVTATVPADGITVVFGPSGSGKTTLLRLCNRLDVPSSGTVSYRGEPVAALDPLVLRRRVGMVFQRPTPFPGTVAENLAVAAPHADEDTCADVLRRVALRPEVLDQPARDLSGGELQRLCLARTLITRPETLLLDEPTSALDEDAKRAFEDTARGLAAGGVPMLWVTHEVAQLHRVAQRVLRLVDGRLEGAAVSEMAGD